MKKEECFSKFVASLIIAFPFMAMFAFLVELFGIEAFIEISKNHGSLVAGLIALLAAVIAVIAQKILERDKVLNAKREELYSTVIGLRTKVVLTRTRHVKDSVISIDALIHDLNKASMLVSLYNIADDGIYTSYRESVNRFLETWSSSFDNPGETCVDKLRADFISFKSETHNLLSHILQRKN